MAFGPHNGQQQVLQHRTEAMKQQRTAIKTQVTAAVTEGTLSAHPSEEQLAPMILQIMAPSDAHIKQLKQPPPTAGEQG